jgi:hypothetical protein
VSAPTCAVTVQVYGPASGAPLRGVSVHAVLDRTDIAADGVVLQVPVVARTDALGLCVLDLFRNAAGNEGSAYVVTFRTPHGLETLRIVVPDEATARLDDIVVDDPSLPLALLLLESGDYLIADDGAPLVQ